MCNSYAHEAEAHRRSYSHTCMWERNCMYLSHNHLLSKRRAERTEHHRTMCNCQLFKICCVSACYMSREYFLTGVTLIKTESFLLRTERTRQGRNGGSDGDRTLLTRKIRIRGGNMKCPNTFLEMSGEQWLHANRVSLII